MKMKKIICIVGFVLSILIYSITIPNKIFYIKDIYEILNIISILVFCLLFIPLPFELFRKPSELKNCYYHGIHIIYILLPVGLFIQYNTLNIMWVALVSLLITFITSFIIYKKLKDIDIYHLTKLKYSSLLFTTILTISFGVLNLMKYEIETFLFIICLSPLLVLRVVYKKLSLNKNF